MAGAPDLAAATSVVPSGGAVAEQGAESCAKPSACWGAEGDSPEREASVDVIEGFRATDRRSKGDSHHNHASSTQLRIRQILDDVNGLLDQDGLESAAVWKVTRTRSFTAGVLAVIIINTVYLGIETDFAKENDSDRAFFAVDVGFIAVFSLEIALRFYDERLAFFKDAWNILDILLNTISIIDTFILGVLESGSSAAELDMVSVVRVLRLLRVARVFRLLRFCRRLWLLMIGVVDAMRALFWAWVLLAVIIYMFAIVSTRSLGKVHSSDPEIDAFFGTVPKSMFTWFQVMTLEAWPSVVRKAMRVEPWVLALFLVFMIVTTYSIMNVIVAVIVEGTLEQASTQKMDLLKVAEEERRKSGSKILQVFGKSDKDGDGQVTKEEFLDAIKRKDVAAYLNDVGVDVRQAENLFDILDFDDSGSLDCDEFITGVLNTRGQAKAKDVLAVQCSVWRTESKMRDEIVKLCESVDTRMARLDGEIDGLRGIVRELGEGVEAMEPLREAKSNS